ncbi:unnamed protein product [Rotaria sp. Silwood1]|nr:unnamed protein product [Rotaria sp. Silwood1]
MFSRRLYRALPYLYALLAIIEGVLTGVTILFMISIRSNSSTGTTTGSTTTTTPIPPAQQKKIDAAFALLIVSATGALLSAGICFCSGFTFWMCFMIDSCRRSFLRCVSLNCNCPCYIPRPRLRFIVRIVFRSIFIILRLVGTIIYVVAFVELSERTAQTLEIILVGILAVTLICSLLAIILDIYYYRVWWAYEPIVDANPSFSEPPLSPKHKRFVPYVLIEKFRTAAIGNQKCKNGNGCKERELEHIVIFHSADFRPQPRWSPDYPIYIGFHRTRADFAISIAHSDMNISQTPPQMLGFGIYFARSITNTEGKAREAGAYICAEVRMGKVLMLTRSELHIVSNKNSWWLEYDTVYLKHEQEERDEFCVKSSNQVLKWIIYIEAEKDKKLALYGMDVEFNDTQCYCV